ncbi:bifunctional DNA-binding transcriptional regulator/O6-methylguanine-DNA methyltransferase Ada [Gluconacetobacter takamatsuzukensis]|uniref:methylated-DNA--[protein]-cysteine S-methyltransferase n=1 Tax=Gluconacetobacter takamatsuzukensis TaxID=1286190 RepID=A0A7W4KEF1_9PROT|nr:bifunctional DNA-binding transcriptional regulator/O6-methylguanine-DNA methyltransferase Ada [Gluconacetobacter takamatsuzukensis]MBB2205423.1 bifunctional DNA-binding transcriptional regulator/O6-methylguanine-DNA methyltransferase Ada [Gluconacetobacter takamatsuzukensis]
MGTEEASVRAARITRDPRWVGIVKRDRGADGRFWYSVTTTQVYCRPSCPSRLARPENTRIHDTVEEARATGARPCRRCDPDGASAEAGRIARVVRACRLIEASEAPPTLAVLARDVGLSPGHFQRVFTGATGLSPRQYAEACRSGRLREALRAAPSVTDALYAAGYGSSSRFYEKAAGMLGMTPSALRRGAPAERLRFAVGESALGAILVASSDKGIVAILLGDDPERLVRDLQDRFPRAEIVGGDRDYEGLVARVVGFVERPGVGLELPVDIRGTVFQQRVWNALREIPAGGTATYAEIARRIGAPAAVRAVANACGANALAVAVPCHRVIRHDGTLSGYRWGVARKAMLLEREKFR